LVVKFTSLDEVFLFSSSFFTAVEEGVTEENVVPVA